MKPTLAVLHAICTLIEGEKFLKVELAALARLPYSVCLNDTEKAKPRSEHMLYRTPGRIPSMRLLTALLSKGQTSIPMNMGLITTLVLAVSITPSCAMPSVT